MSKMFKKEVTNRYCTNKYIIFKKKKENKLYALWKKKKEMKQDGSCGLFLSIISLSIDISHIKYGLSEWLNVGVFFLSTKSVDIFSKHTTNTNLMDIWATQLGLHIILLTWHRAMFSWYEIWPLVIINE